jgi:hypothetical protein
MLLSIPLTIMVKIAFESQEETKWIGVMMGSGADAGEIKLNSEQTGED